MPASGYRKQDEKRRTKRVSTYLTDDEHAAFAERVRLCGLTEAAFLREVLAGKTPRPKPSRITSDVLYHLGRIGTNLNQLAHAANRGQMPSAPILTAALEELSTVLNRLVTHDQER